MSFHLTFSDPPLTQQSPCHAGLSLPLMNSISFKFYLQIFVFSILLTEVGIAFEKLKSGQAQPITGQRPAPAICCEHAKAFFRVLLRIGARGVMAMESTHNFESLGVAEAVQAMTNEEVFALVDDVYASGFVRTLHDVTSTLASIHELPSAPPLQLPLFS